VDNTISRPARRSDDLGIVDGLVQLSTLVQAVLARVADSLGLSVLQARLLGVLRDREPTMAQLGRLLDLDKSSTTGLIDRATRRGLVRRAQVPADGRSFRVVLTSEGRDLAQALTTEVTAQMTALTDGLTDTNRHRLSLLVSGIVQRHALAHGIDLSTGITPPGPVAVSPTRGTPP
jgi:DNA-binding MarR family transcriptional regulator